MLATPNSSYLTKVVGNGVFSSSIYLQGIPGGGRFAPEYIHARFAVDYDGCAEKDLNEVENV